MNDMVTCRIAKKSDLPEILRLYAQPVLDDGKVLSRTEAETIFEKSRSYPNYKFYIALLSGRVVGTFAMLIMDNLLHLGAASAVIEAVAVDPAYQGQGVGKAMMKHALDEAGKYGCYKAMLSSNLKRDLAHKFYESLGFDRHGYSFRIDLNGAGAGERKPPAEPARQASAKMGPNDKSRECI